MSDVEPRTGSAGRSPIVVGRTRRSAIANLLIAHLFGLCVAGSFGSAASIFDFEPMGAEAGLFIGGMLSTPFIVGAVALIIIGGPAVFRRPLLFAALGPPLVVGCCALLGKSLLQEVAISTTVSSGIYLLLVYSHDNLSRMRQRTRERTDQ